MMYEEFCRIAGYEVSREDYDRIIEPMYTATDLDKRDFIACLDKKRFALETKQQLKNKMKKICQHLAETCEQYTDYPALDRLEKIGAEYARRFYGVNRADIKDGFWFYKQYAYPEIQRGCTYPVCLAILKNNEVVDRIFLIGDSYAF